MKKFISLMLISIFIISCITTVNAKTARRIYYVTYDLNGGKSNDTPYNLQKSKIQFTREVSRFQYRKIVKSTKKYKKKTKVQLVGSFHTYSKPGYVFKKLKLIKKSKKKKNNKKRNKIHILCDI